MDPKPTKKRSELPDKTIEGPKHVSKDTSSSHALKCCSLCSTTKTPLWRGGPSGPKSLCNACGIRHRKKRRERVGCKGKRRAGFDGGAHMRRDGGAKVGFLGLILRLRRRRERLAEEEEAAILLMALSSGFLYGLKS